MAPGLFTAGLCRVRNKSRFAASVLRGLIPINSGWRTRSNSRAAFWSSSSFSRCSKTIWDSLHSPHTPWFRLLIFVTIQSWCWPSFHSQIPSLHAPLATKNFVHTLKQSGADLFGAPAWGLREHTAPPIASQALTFPLRLLGRDPVSFSLSPALHIYLKCFAEKHVQRVLVKQWGDGDGTLALGLVVKPAAIRVGCPLGVLSRPRHCAERGWKHLMTFRAHQKIDIVIHLQNRGVKVAALGRSRNTTVVTVP